jgi:hypothetical protein
MRRCRFAQHRKRTAVMASCFGCTLMVHETRLAGQRLGKEAELRMHEHLPDAADALRAVCFSHCELQGIPAKL